MPADATTTPSAESAERALSMLGEMSAEMRAGAILGADGEVLASDGPADAWAERVSALLEQADAAGGGPAEHIHVATEAGELFLTRLEGLTVTAITERFALASLMAFDMRSVLADLAAEDS
jgi:predicted regulator of Ras-like GTPase activity (Roadblock/LC7/MglB family)